MCEPCQSAVEWIYKFCSFTQKSTRSLLITGRKNVLWKSAISNFGFRKKKEAKEDIRAFKQFISWAGFKILTFLIMGPFPKQTIIACDTLDSQYTDTVTHKGIEIGTLGCMCPGCSCWEETSSRSQRFTEVEWMDKMSYSGPKTDPCRTPHVTIRTKLTLTQFPV